MIIYNSLKTLTTTPYWPKTALVFSIFGSVSQYVLAINTYEFFLVIHYQPMLCDIWIESAPVWSKAYY